MTPVRRAPAIAIALCSLAGSFGLPGVRAAPPQRCPGPDAGSPALVASGGFGEDLEGASVMVPFQVPDATTRVRARICYDQPDAPTNARIRHTLDLGIYGARGADGIHDVEEFRGWGGSSRPDVLITPEEATLGFMPGAIEPGEWAAEIGVAAIAGTLEGDADGTVGWRLEVFLGADPADLDDPWEPAPYDTAPTATGPGWYKGDFHVHAEHSSPNDATMRETFDYAFGPAGLDFITLSDYVGTRQWDEIGRLQTDHPGRLVIRSAEVITYRGHVNNHGSARYVDHRTGPVYEWQEGAVVNIRQAEPASRILADIRAAGGWTQVNHPTIFPSAVPGFSSICRGCAWDYTDAETDWSLVDAFEVQTGPAGTAEPQGNELGPNPFTPPAIEWWDRLVRAGYRITAVGSSDSHRAGRTTDVTQSPVGEATTVVYAGELSEAAIGAAVRAGHAYVKFFGADGPDLRLDATAPDGTHAMMGDRLETSSASMVARVIGGGPTVASPQPRILVVFRDGGPILAVPVPSPDFTLPFEAPAPGAYRLQLQRGSAIEALTNPIFLTG